MSPCCGCNWRSPPPLPPPPAWPPCLNRRAPWDCSVATGSGHGGPPPPASLVLAGDGHRQRFLGDIPFLDGAFELIRANPAHEDQENQHTAQTKTQPDLLLHQESASASGAASARRWKPSAASPAG